MSLQLSKDIRTISDLKQKPRELIEHAKETRRPVVVTVNGRADAVILDAESYESLLMAARLADRLEEAEADVRHGRMQEIQAFFQGTFDE